MCVGKGQSYWYDSAHIPVRTEGIPVPEWRASFLEDQKNSAMLYASKRKGTTYKRTAEQISKAISEPPSVWSLVRKQGRFSPRDFSMDDSFPDPLHNAASFAYLEFSYRAIPLRRIRFACRLIGGAEFSSRNRNVRGAGYIADTNNGAIL